MRSSNSIRIGTTTKTQNEFEIFGKTIITDLTDEYIAIALLLMHEKLKGPESLWKPYLDILPKPEDVYPSFIWTEKELDSLKGSPAYYASKSLRFDAMTYRYNVVTLPLVTIAEPNWRRNTAS
jgi:hypothetical protein